MDNQIARFRKIHINSFIEQLVMLYESGVDFVDLVGKNDVEQDVIELHYCDEYLCPEKRMDEKNLSDEDLNQII